MGMIAGALQRNYNPPYVRIHNIESEYRNLVKHFRFADGTTDLYIVFYDIGIQMLKPNSGKLGYISPNSFLRNTSQKKFRNYLIDNQLLSKLSEKTPAKCFIWPGMNRLFLHACCNAVLGGPALPHIFLIRPK